MTKSSTATTNTRLMAQARTAALQRLAREQPHLFAPIHDDERAKRGLPPAGPRQSADPIRGQRATTVIADEPAMHPAMAANPRLGKSVKQIVESAAPPPTVVARPQSKEPQEKCTHPVNRRTKDGHCFACGAKVGK